MEAAVIYSHTTLYIDPTDHTCIAYPTKKVHPMSMCAASQRQGEDMCVPTSRGGIFLLSIDIFACLSCVPADVDVVLWRRCAAALGELRGSWLPTFVCDFPEVAGIAAGSDRLLLTMRHYATVRLSHIWKIEVVLLSYTRAFRDHSRCLRNRSSCSRS